MRSNCELFTTCVGSASMNSCLSNSACASDDYALACTASTAGVCMTMWGEVDEGSVSHFVCGSTSVKVQVVATPTAGSGSASVTARSTSISSGLPRSSSSVSGDDDDDDSSATRSSRASTSSIDDRPRINTAVTAATRAATTTQSTAGAVKTAQAILGAAGGLAGVVALFF